MSSLQSFLAVKPAAGWGAGAGPAAPQSRRARVSACLAAAPPPPATAGPPRWELSAASRAVMEDEARYLVGTYKRSRVVFEYGRGCKLYDLDGREYLDMAAGIAVTALGHADPDVCATISEQVGKAIHASNAFYTEPQVGAPGPPLSPRPPCVRRIAPSGLLFSPAWFTCRELAKRLVEMSFADRAFFASTGTEANEAAIKFSRKFQRVAHPESDDPPMEFLAFSSSFHGRTMGAVALTSKSQYREPFAPVMPGVTFVGYGDLEAAKQFIQSGRVAAVFVEPVQGEGGIQSATKEFLQGLRQACDEAGALLVFDEVQCGFGRTGYLWAHEAYGVEPDIMTLAKPLANGIPIGVVLVKEKVAAAINYGDHSTTFGGGPLACRTAITVLDKITKPGFLAEVSKKGESFNQLLRTKMSGNPHEGGVVVLTAGKGNVVRLLPPLIISEKELEQAADVIRDCLPALDLATA